MILNIIELHILWEVIIIDNYENQLIAEKLKNTETILDKEYTLDEFDNEGVKEVVEKYLEAKEKSELTGDLINTELEYYPYISGVKCLEITFFVREK